MAKPQHVPPNGWDRFSITAEIHRQGMTFGELAKRAGITLKTFSQVWTRTNRRAEKAVADFLNTKPDDLWPDRYPIRSARILSSKHANHSASQKACSEADRKAA